MISLYQNFLLKGAEQVFLDAFNYGKDRAIKKAHHQQFVSKEL